MFRFENIIYIYALAIIPILIIWFIIVLKIRKKAIAKFGDIQLLNMLMPDVSIARYKLKFIIFLISLVFIFVGLANPQVGSKLQQVKRNGVEVMIALDVSNSMLAKDIKPNRLDRAKRAISNLIGKLNNDKIGIIVFAGDAFVQLPITTDYSSAKMFLSTINTGIVPVQGTAISKAIDLAMSSYSPNNDKNKALIIITDGENHDDDAIALAEEANKKGIIVNTIGMGLPDGGPIPISNKFGKTEYKKDKDGNVIVTKLDEQNLSQIAMAGGGTYIRASNNSTGLQPIYDKINKMDKTEFENQIYSDYEDRFQYFLAIGIFLLLIDLLIIEKKNKIFSKLNLFEAKLF